MLKTDSISAEAALEMKNLIEDLYGRNLTTGRGYAELMFEVSPERFSAPIVGGLRLKVDDLKARGKITHEGWSELMDFLAIQAPKRY